jgi:DNA adenine methylase
MPRTLFGADIITSKIKAKPFLKWAGGKSQLLDEIEKRLPDELTNGQTDTYVEPFVGGGAVFFYIAQNYPKLKRFHLIDINEDLIRCYNAIRTDVKSVVFALQQLEESFLQRNKEQRKRLYYEIRKQFNNDREVAKLIFLNKTCYNGLYRVNRKNEFNVPFGDYKNPKICDAENLKRASLLLERAKIICGDFTDSDRYIGKHTFVYFDPPYRPLSQTASFTSYSKHSFSEKDQVRLAEYCRKINSKGAKFLLSNSDPKNEDPNDHFFENHYEEFSTERVKASRAINCKASKRGQINELIITNYR